MKTTLMLLSLALAAALFAPAADTLAPEAQIAAAVLPSPEEYRADATVLGYDASGALVKLREGKNDMICLADDPKKDGISVACYHKDLEPFMARGRELVAQGVTGKKRDEMRGQEVKEGKVKMPREPRTLYVMTGSSYDAATNKIAESYLRWVIYTPFATAESLGLSTKGSPNAPWLMAPGTAGAHIMINPPKNK